MDFVTYSAPSADRRWRIVDATMRRHGHQAHALIETLHTVQESFGYLDKAALQYVAAALRVPLSRAYGVATFYHLFNLKPQGEHVCVICMGTACYIKGAASIAAAAEEMAGIQPGETTADGTLSLLIAHCIGACSLAPSGVFDGEVAGRLTVAQVQARLEGWMHHDR